VIDEIKNNSQIYDAKHKRKKLIEEPLQSYTNLRDIQKNEVDIVQASALKELRGNTINL